MTFESNMLIPDLPNPDDLRANIAKVSEAVTVLRNAHKFGAYPTGGIKSLVDILLEYNDFFYQLSDGLLETFTSVHAAYKAMAAVSGLYSSLDAVIENAGYEIWQIDDKWVWGKDKVQSPLSIPANNRTSALLELISVTISS